VNGVLDYTTVEIKTRLRLRKKPILDNEEVVLDEKFVRNLIESVLEPDEQILDFECCIESNGGDVNGTS